MRAGVAAGHPDDIAARNTLIDQYTIVRRGMRVSAPAVARRMQVSRCAVQTFEWRRPANPEIATLIRYGAVLDLGVVLSVSGLKDTESTTAEALLACGYVGNAMLARLIAARLASGVSQTQLALANDWPLTSVANLETNDAEPRLATLQRFARGLGGRLHARWEVL